MIIIFFLIWLFAGGKEYKYVGLQGLHPNYSLAEKRFLDLDVTRSPKKIKPTNGNVNTNNIKNLGLTVLSKFQNKELDNQESASDDKDELNNQVSSSEDSLDSNSNNKFSKEKKFRKTKINIDSDSESEDSSSSEDKDSDIDSEVDTGSYESESSDSESIDAELDYGPKDKINNKLEQAENNRAEFNSYVSPDSDNLKHTATQTKDLYIQEPAPVYLSPVPQKFLSSKAETQCRRILEAIFNKPFPQVRPSFLNNPETNRNLEIDCYNAELKLGVEYNSEYHYKWPNFTGQTKEEFIKVLRRDDYKRRACDEEGVYLIIVPYTVPFSKFEDYIREQIEIWRKSL